MSKNVEIKKKKKPIRKCVACREHREKRDLLRIVRLEDNDIVVDFTYRANGRGAYICKCTECFDLAVKQKAFNRAFKCDVKESDIKQIGEAIKREKT